MCNKTNIFIFIFIIENINKCLQKHFVTVLLLQISIIDESRYSKM